MSPVLPVPQPLCWQPGTPDLESSHEAGWRLWLRCGSVGTVSRCVSLSRALGWESLTTETLLSTTSAAHAQCCCLRFSSGGGRVRLGPVPAWIGTRSFPQCFL